MFVWLFFFFPRSGLLHPFILAAQSIKDTLLHQAASDAAYLMIKDSYLKILLAQETFLR